MSVWESRNEIESDIERGTVNECVAIREYMWIKLRASVQEYVWKIARLRLRSSMQVRQEWMKENVSDRVSGNVWVTEWVWEYEYAWVWVSQEESLNESESESQNERVRMGVRVRVMIRARVWHNERSGESQDETKNKRKRMSVLEREWRRGEITNEYVRPRVKESDIENGWTRANEREHQSEWMRERENENWEWVRVNQRRAVRESESENKSERGPLAGPPKIHRNSAAIKWHQLAPFVFHLVSHSLFCVSSFRYHIGRSPTPPRGECDERLTPLNHPQISSRSPPGPVKPNIYKATWISLLDVLPPLISLFRILRRSS